MPHEHIPITHMNVQNIFFIYGATEMEIEAIRVTEEEIELAVTPPTRLGYTGRRSSANTI